jgi:hypothetical protein
MHASTLPQEFQGTGIHELPDPSQLPKSGSYVITAVHENCDWCKKEVAESIKPTCAVLAKQNVPCFMANVASPAGLQNFQGLNVPKFRGAVPFDLFCTPGEKGKQPNCAYQEGFMDHDAFNQALKSRGMMK